MRLDSGLAAALLAALPWICFGQEGPAARADDEHDRLDKDPQAVLSSIVRVNMKALEGARSRSTLGSEREGTGVVIDARGNILTIGYIATEASSIDVTTQAGSTVPAVLQAYDHATGLAILRATAPMPGVTPMPLGSSDALELREPVMVLPQGGRANASIAYVVSKRKFTASWEYLLESAIFVSPPSMQWAGAALVNREGRLVGIGSLLLRAVDLKQPVPGNMFVPVDALKPILADLIARGRRSGPARPWMGLGTEELQGHLIVTNVSQDGPADRAGIRRGDIVVGVASVAVAGHEEFYRAVWALGPAGVDIPLKVVQGAELKEFRIHSADRLDYLRERH